MKILNFGSCNIDYVYSVGHAVREGETISSHHREVFAGGKGLNQSVAAARAGGDKFCSVRSASMRCAIVTIGFTSVGKGGTGSLPAPQIDL